MAKKKTTKKKEDDESAFDFTESLATIDTSECLKAGFIDYIQINNIQINSGKELTDELTKFNKMNAGV